MRSNRECRKDFEREFFLLAEMARSGTLRFSDTSAIESLHRIGTLPNHRISLATINETDRTVSLMAAARAHDPADTKM